MDIFEFKDTKVVPDPVHKYSASLRDSQIPLIIDNGSYQCRVGWMTSESPILRFKSVIAKPRKERSKKDKDNETTQTPQIQVGNDITNLEAVRFQLKTQFDRNIVTHYEAQEHIFDYIFTHLGINNEGSVPHPIVMTEAFLNPNYSRQLMSELLFECYAVPSVCYGVDALFGYNFGQSKTHQSNQNTLIISLGYYNIHIIPILGGKVIYQHSRRINIGGYHIVTFLHKLLQLKYPAHSAQITLGRVEELLHHHCEIAIDYQEELNRWSNSDYYEDNIRRIQLPYAIVVPISGLTLEQQKERKKELAQRLISLNARKREERLAEDEDKLSSLLQVQEHYDEGEDELFTRGLEENSFKSMEELQKNITVLNTRIEKTRVKIMQANSNEEKPEEIVEETKIKPGKFEPAPNEDLQTWLLGVKRKRQDLLTKRHARKQRRSDLAKRRTAAAQERMRLISQLARKEKGNDDFGMRDEDWDIYKTISRDAGDSDSEVENEKLLELEEILKHHEPAIQGALGEGGEQEGVGEAYQLHLGVERFRAPEVVFQPSMVGLIEAGLAETIGYILQQFSPENQQLLVDNIVLLGGASQIKGLRGRLTRELREIRPFQSKLTIQMANNPELCSWVGAKNFAKSPELKKCLISKAEYLEYGGEYLKSYSCGNVYFPTPKNTTQGEIIDI